MVIPRILITPGEPAGIGPEIVLKLAERKWDAELVVVADPQLLTNIANKLLIKLIVTEVNLNDAPVPNSIGHLKILPVKLNAPNQEGKPNILNASYVIHSLEKATDLCLAKKASALVTGPVNKNLINEAGYKFTGHTEFLANRCHANQVLMLFVAKETKVAIATTHLPLAEVPRAITQEKLIAQLRLLNAELKKKFKISDPKILVCGLNPHAGEQGHLGNEEIDIIKPALQKLENEMHINGPLPADTVFTPKYLNNYDAILAMYHDQALPVVKYLSFGHAVNVTLGLPIIRTSVDHGTALDIAGKGVADSGSLIEAVSLAINLV